MKIYFSASIRGGRQDIEIYQQIIGDLKQYGTVLTEMIGEKGLTAMGSDRPERSIYEKDMAWLRQSDVVVAEVTAPSLGVGYELAKAEEMGKPILCLYRETPGRNLSAMIAGNPVFTIRRYADESEVPWILEDFFQDSAE